MRYSTVLNGLCATIFEQSVMASPVLYWWTICDGASGYGKLPK